MAEHRPTDTLLALLQQTLESAPQGMPPRHLLDRLVELGEDISRPTLNRLLVQGVEQGLWAPHGNGRSVIYMLGQTIPTPQLSSTDTPMTDAQNTSSASLTDAKHVQPQKRGKAVKEKKEVKPASLYDRIRDVVWWVADTLRDKTGLQVEAYQPVTLAMLALKRNFDIQLEQLQAGGKTAEILVTELPMLKAGLRDIKDVARALNGANGFWDATQLQGGRFGLPLMTWADLVNFKDSDTNGPRTEPLVMVLNANPEGHRTPETALFTYTTQAPDLKALILEIVDSMVPDLREAFGAIGLYSVLGTGSEHAATLSNGTLRYICTTQGTSGAARLVDFDLGLKNISVDVFSDTYMDLLGRFAEDSGKRGGEYFTPTSMVDNLLKFIPTERFVKRIHDDPTWVMRIADPTAGSNTFLIKAHEHLEQAAKRMGLPTPPHRQLAFFAQELKNTQVGLGVFNMFYHGLAPRLNPSEEEIYVGRRPEEGGIVARTTGNTITEYIDKIGKQADKIDLALANPPYGTADYGLTHALSARGHVKDGRWISGVPTRSEGEWPFVQTIVNLLSPTGMAGIVLPMGLLFRDGGSDYRQWLIENDWIEGVIAAPSNQFLTTSIPVCLLIINKNKDPEHRGGVFFVNATEDFTKQGKFNHWNVERALQAWEERREEAGYSGFVSTERFRKAPKSTLAVSRWFSPISEKEALNPNEMSQMATSIQDMLGRRGKWLEGVMGQVERCWSQPYSEGEKEIEQETPDTVLAKSGSGQEVEEWLPGVRILANQSWKTVEMNGTDVEIPKDWDVAMLKDFCRFVNGSAFKPSDWNLEGKGLKIARIQNLSRSEAEYNYTERDKENLVLIAQGDLLMSWSGTIDMFKWEGPTAALNQHIFRVDISEEIQRQYMEVVLKSKIPYIKSLAHGATMVHVRKEPIATTQFAKAKDSEQTLIAQALIAQQNQILDLEKLIEVEKKRLEWLSDELLSGRIRMKQASKE